MEGLRILEKEERLNWGYDDEADVLYISIGEPRPAESVDIGEGTIVRIDPKNKELIGLTLINLIKRILKGLELE